MTSVIELEVRTNLTGDKLSTVGDNLNKLERQSKKASDGLSVLDISMGTLIASGVQSLISGLGNAAQAMVEFGKEGLELASDAAETESLLTNALGPAYDDFAASVDRVSDATGRSSRVFKEQISPILAMTKAQGFANEVAAETSVAFGQAALDLNSYFNSTTGFEDLQSALAGSAETLQKYGIDARQSVLQTQALEMGLIEAGEAMDQATRTTALLALVQEQAADAMGDAARTADGFANRQRALNDVFGDFKAEVGGALLEAVGPLQEELLTLSRDRLPDVAEQLSVVIERSGLAAVGLVELAERTKTAFEGFQQTQFGAVIGSAFESRLFGGDTGLANVLNEGTGFASPLARIRNISRDFGIVFGELEKLGEESLATSESMDFLASNVDEFGDSLGSIGPELEGATEGLDPAPIENYAIAITKAGKAYQLGVDIFNEQGFSEALDEAFGGSTVEKIDSTASALNRVVTNVSNLATKAAEFSGGDFISLFDGEIDEAGLFTEVAQRLPDNVNVGLTIDLLREGGESEETLENIAQELIEDQLGDRLAAQFDAGLISEQELVNKTKELFTELENLQDPLLLIEQGTGAIADALNDLNSDFQSTLTFQLEGYEQLLNAKAIIEELSGQQIGGNDLPTTSTITSGELGRTNNSISSISRRRGGPS